MTDTKKILDRLEELHPKAIDLSLNRIKSLLKKLDNPEQKLPPVIHIAGTNGKGSTQAFLKAIFESHGLKVHAYTSPHLVNFNERIYLKGEYIKDDKLEEILQYIEKINNKDPITFFEITTVAAFIAFSREPADILILETGLGGKLDATNVIKKPLASVLTPISLDHEDYLGSNVINIALEKAHIIKKDCLSVIGVQEKNIKETILNFAKKKNSKTYCQGIDWNFKNQKNDLYVTDNNEYKNFGSPSLLGDHQFMNAALAIATIKHIQNNNECFSFDNKKIKKGIENASWKARLQKLDITKLNINKNYEIILDGGHNPDAGKAIGKFLNQNSDIKTDIITGILKTKDAIGYYKPIVTQVENIVTIPIKNSKAGYNEQDLAKLISSEFNKKTEFEDDVLSALKNILKKHKIKNDKRRILICGSLYLAGEILKKLTNC